MKLLNMAAWGYVLGVLFFGAIFALAAGFTLMTTQLLFERGFVSVNDLHYSWGILWQLDNAVQGEYTGLHLIAVIASWVLLACYTIANSVKKWIKAGIAHEGLEIFCHAMVILDGIANWNSLTSAPWYWQIIFVLSIYTVLGHFGKIVIGLATLSVMEFF